MKHGQQSKAQNSRRENLPPTAHSCTHKSHAVKESGHFQSMIEMEAGIHRSKEHTNTRAITPPSDADAVDKKVQIITAKPPKIRAAKAQEKNVMFT